MAIGALGEGFVATKHSNDSTLAELLSQDVGQTGEYELKVLRSGIVEYSYQWQRKQTTPTRSQAIPR